MNLLKRFFVSNSTDKQEAENGVEPTNCASELQYFSVCGFMRSGTNWANNLLNLHPHIACHGEYHFDHVRPTFDQWINRNWSVAKAWGKQHQVAEHFELFIKQTMLECALADPQTQNKSIRWLGDRSPRLLESEAVSNAKHFRLIRDGRDVLVSWTYLSFADNYLGTFDQHPAMLEKVEKFKHDPNYFLSRPKELLDDVKWVTQIARQWNSRVNKDDQYISETKSEETDASVMSIRYEDLHRETEKIRKAMYNFLDLDADLALSLDAGRHKTSAGFGEEDPQSLYRKGSVGDWKKYFSPTTKQIFEEFAGDALSRHGYLDQ